MRFSIRELVLALLALLLFSFGGIIWTNRTTANAEIVSSMQSILSNVSSSTTARSEDFLAEARRSTEVAAFGMSQGLLESDDALENYFASVLRATPSANGIFYGTVEGEFLFVSRSDEIAINGFRTKLIRMEADERTVELIDRDQSFAALASAMDPSDTYDPRARPWYQAAMNEAGTVITDPYVFFTSQRPGITTASPVYDADGTILGVVGVDVELSALSRFLGDLSLGTNGSAFIFNTDGEVVALERLDLIQQPDGDGFRLSSVYELNSEVLSASYAASINLGSQARTFTTTDDGSTLHAFVAPIEQTDWILGVSLDENDFLGDVRAEQQRSNLIALALALVGIAVGWRLIQNVTVPLRELRERALDIERGELTQKEPSTAAIEELRATSDAFDHMVAGLLDQQAENAELIADLEARAASKTIDLRRTVSAPGASPHDKRAGRGPL